ncbi:MAG: twin-arginine translocase TatA/TatE family subunit [Acidimicrobiia bacterium]|jgi:sec-independent protein translocase protein TatB
MLQTGEIIIIALLALVVLGPRRLPEMARRAGHWASELRKAAREITAGLEAEVAEFKELGDELRTPIKEIGDEVSSAVNERYEWTGPKPVSGPTPEDAMRDFEKMQSEGEDPDAIDSESEE